MTFDLLLRYPDGNSILDELGAESAAFINAPLVDDQGQPDFLGHDGDSNAMDQGWGVLYPEDQPELFEAIARLRDWRQQGIKEAHEARGARGSVPSIRAWKIAPGSSPRAFLQREYLSLPQHERPAYLLILGDFDGISLAFAQGLMLDAFVGRLCVPTIEDYAGYARKVVAAETQRAKHERPRLALMSSSSPARPDGAVDQGHHLLISPLHDDFVAPELELGLDPSDVHWLGPRGRNDDARDWAGVCSVLSDSRPSVFVSLSHGSGDPRWCEEEQRARQGRLNLGGGRELDLDTIARGPFLPDGAWFYYACFGGGTPQTSAFEPWLRKLVGARVWRRVPEVLATQARSLAFVALQPQLALANPEGPLAVIAHADLAFTYAFSRAKGQDLEWREGRALGEPAWAHHGPVRDVVQSLAGGSRAGLALSKLRPALHDADQALLRQWHDREHGESALVRMLIDKSRASSAVDDDPAARALLSAVRAVITEVGPMGVTLDRVAQQAGEAPDELLSKLGQAIGKAALAHIGQNWMARHDLGGWFLLGDPAARLPLALHGSRPVSEAQAMRAVFGGTLEAASPASTARSRLAGINPDRLEEALAAYAYFVELRGERSGQELAQEYGLSFRDLRRWYERWSAAGRLALASDDRE